uniref:Uncharacterized protein n=1 Tax=Aegilops tauschii subsp. strangulata TaxID=200361 RepID=A0A453LXC9_AEGTS
SYTTMCGYSRWNFKTNGCKGHHFSFFFAIIWYGSLFVCSRAYRPAYISPIVYDVRIYTIRF